MDSLLERFSNPEIFLALAVAALGFAAARGNWRWIGWWERPLARLARRRKLAILIAALTPMFLRALLLPLYPAPQPRVHDEFSFLLGADTLAHGRVANPPHPLWMHFESFHILTHPSYASAFPMGQSAALAAGKLLLGRFWAGVWLSMGLMCGAICWMLQGWLPPRWALLGALLVILRIAVSSYWMNSYWGGSVAAAGGALVLGALPRLKRSPHWRDAAIMAVGLVLLANTRAFEGLVFSLVVAVALFAWMLGRSGPPAAVALRRIVVPIVLILVVAGGAMGYAFVRITAKAWLPPYVLYRGAMTTTPHFLWQTLSHAPLYNNQDMRNFYVVWEKSEFDLARHSLAADLFRKAAVYWHFYIGPLLTIPLLAIRSVWRDRKTRQLLLMAAGFSMALIPQVWHNYHYAAPATGLCFLILVVCMRRLRAWRWDRRSPSVVCPFGLHLVRLLPMACAAMLLIQIAAGRAPDEATVQAGWRWPPPAGLKRAAVLAQLEHMGGKHVVLVRYGLHHHPGDEWVYNGADIDGASVVWARELDRASNARLLEYFRDRQAWLVEPDLPSPRLEPYSGAAPRPMLFVQLGAPGIPALQNVDQIRRGVLAQVAAHEHTALLNCDVWNFYFTEVTGVWGADVVNGCFDGNNRGQPVTFEHWFQWLQRQK